MFPSATVPPYGQGIEVRGWTSTVGRGRREVSGVGVGMVEHHHWRKSAGEQHDWDYALLGNIEPGKQWDTPAMFKWVWFFFAF